MAEFKKFVVSLLSRKFLFTVAGVAYFTSVGDMDNATILVLGYLAAEGIGDAAERYKS